MSTRSLRLQTILKAMYPKLYFKAVLMADIWQQLRTHFRFTLRQGSTSQLFVNIQQNK